MLKLHESLLTDFYQLSMMQAYHKEVLDDRAVFEFFIRKTPANRNFFVFAGLEQLLDYLVNLAFDEEDLSYLVKDTRLHGDFLDYLKRFKFTGDVYALQEGEIFFPNEPVVRVEAPLPEAQLVESRLINILQYQILVASKAARCYLMAPDRQLIDFGFRRAHGSEAGVLASRAAFLAGFTGTATLEAGRLFNIPTYGTMAHSYIQAHEHEEAAFLAFARTYPKNTVLLIDTYDCEQAAHTLVRIAPKLKKEKIDIAAVRIDSGDMAAIANRIRCILDEGGLNHVQIMVSGNLDEEAIAILLQKAPKIHAFGVGTSLTTSSDAPYLDCAYKIQMYANKPRRKRSPGKATWPGSKEVYRFYDQSGRMTGDKVCLHEEKAQGEKLLKCVMKNGEIIAPSSLQEARSHFLKAITKLPETLKTLEPSSYPVEISTAVQKLAQQLDAELP